MRFGKVPGSAVLYLVSIGFGVVTLWQVSELLQVQTREMRVAATQRGEAAASQRLPEGRVSVGVLGEWRYVRGNRDWWGQLRRANFLGQSRKIADEVPGRDREPPEGSHPIVPLEDIIELSMLVFDGGDGGELSHVMVRYAPESGVTPPASYATRELATPGVVLQRLDVGTPLWPPHDGVRLASVAADAQSAFFLRDGTTERLFKTAFNLSQEVLRELSRLAGMPPSKGVESAPKASQDRWIDQVETTLVEGRVNVGRADAERFRRDGALLEQFSFARYVSPRGRRGLILRDVDPKLAARFGVARGEVILSINGVEVRREAQALRYGRDQYRKGVRRFVTVWLAAGREVERVIQLPDR